MMVYQVHLRDGRTVLILAAHYRHEDGKHIFDHARILPQPPLYSRADWPTAKDVMSLADSEVKQVEELVPLPPVAGAAL
jgi:hypothetical protein